MLKCPACNKMISPERNEKWFQCSNCENWVRLRVNSQRNTTWLELGIRANEYIFPVRVPPPAPGVQPDRSSTPPKTLEQSTITEQMSLETVQNSRLEIAAQLRALESELKRLAGVMSANQQNIDNIRKVKSDMDRLADQEKSLKERDKELEERESVLAAEKERELAKASSSADNGGWAFGCSAVLVAAALITFGMILKIQWNATAILGLLGIALAGGFAFLMGYIILK